MTDLHTHKMPANLTEAFRQKLERHAHADEEKALIEKAKAKGWRMVPFGRSRSYFRLFGPNHALVLGVSIEDLIPCRVCQPLTYDEARALAWEELLSWIGPDKLRRLVG